jgi:allantoin racemase
MRIMWQNTTTAEIPGVEGFNRIGENLTRHFNNIVHPDTEVVVKNLDISTNSVRSFYGEFLNNYYVVESIIQEKDNYDAIVIGCFPDPGILELREMLDIPVIGLGEAAMLVATTIGSKFAIVSVDKNINPNMERALLRYGLDKRAIYRPIRAVDPPITVCDDIVGYSDPFKTIIPRIEKVARECIGDGAEVILTGCGYIGPMLSLNGYNKITGTNVPIIDSSSVAIKFAEMMAGLQKTIGLKVSRCSYFNTPSLELINKIRGNVGLASFG